MNKKKDEPAIEILKEKARKKKKQMQDRRKKQNRNKEIMTTIPEEESDEEENIPGEQDEEQNIKLDQIDEVNTESDELTTCAQMTERGDTVQEKKRSTRQGERQRHKTDFNEQNFMISRIEGLQ